MEGCRWTMLERVDIRTERPLTGLLVDTGAGVATDGGEGGRRGRSGH